MVQTNCQPIEDIEGLLLRMKLTFPGKQKYHKPSNIKGYDTIRLLTRHLFTNFDYVSFETCLTHCTLFILRGSKKIKKIT